jgi:hypothetical protein
MRNNPDKADVLNDVVRGVLHDSLYKANKNLLLPLLSLPITSICSSSFLVNYVHLSQLAKLYKFRKHG